MRLKLMKGLNKRGIMGIGTLIIFIATILVAAVAAAVLISTSNVLQQRSLLVGQEARKTITDGVDVFSILAQSNTTTETFNNFEVLLRLSPGSDPLQMRKFDIEILSHKVHIAAILSVAPDDNIENLSGSVTIVPRMIYDLDADGTDDLVYLVNHAPDDYIRFNLSTAGISDNISIGKQATNGAVIKVAETAIRIGDEIYGTVEINGLGDAADSIDNIGFTIRKVASECKFDLLPPETTYCYVSVIGNDDYVLDSREKFKIRIKTKDANALNVGEDIMFIFASEKGRMTEARARTPDVVTYASTRIWPLD